MAVIAPPLLVPAPVRSPLPFGLFSVLTFRASADPHWQLGVQWEPISCEPLAPVLTADCDPDERGGLPKVFEPGGGLAEASAFTVYGSYNCTSTGNTLDHGQEVATQRLLAGEEAAVTAELISIVAAASGAPPTADGTDPAAALGAVEADLAGGYRAQGLVIMDRATATVLASLALVAASGARLQTVLGTPVILSARPLDPPGLILGCPIPFGYRSEVFTSSNRVGDLLDRATNELFAVAERTYLIGLDPCGFAAATAAPEVVAA